MYIWNQHKIIYQKKPKVEISLYTFFNEKRKNVFSTLELHKANILCELSLVLLILDVVLHL